MNILSSDKGFVRGIKGLFAGAEGKLRAVILSLQLMEACAATGDGRFHEGK